MEIINLKINQDVEIFSSFYEINQQQVPKVGSVSLEDFFNLIKIKDAIFASQSNFLIPCFGTLWSFIFLDEILSHHMIYGLLLIVIGGWLVNSSARQ